MHPTWLHANLCMASIAVEHTSIAAMRAFETIAVELVYIDIATRRSSASEFLLKRMNSRQSELPRFILLVPNEEMAAGS